MVYSYIVLFHDENKATHMIMTYVTGLAKTRIVCTKTETYFIH